MRFSAFLPVLSSCQTALDCTQVQCRLVLPECVMCSSRFVWTNWCDQIQSVLPPLFVTYEPPSTLTSFALFMIIISFGSSPKSSFDWWNPFHRQPTHIYIPPRSSARYSFDISQASPGGYIWWKSECVCTRVRHRSRWKWEKEKRKNAQIVKLNYKHNEVPRSYVDERTKKRRGDEGETHWCSKHSLRIGYAKK